MPELLNSEIGLFGFNMITYRNLNFNEINENLFSNFVRRQVVTKCWRRIDGCWVIIDAPFIDDWSGEDYRALIINLKQILKCGGLVFGAFSEGNLKGFAAVPSYLTGSKKQYADLLELHVSEDMRRRGIGTKLFAAAVNYAKDLGAERLYISAHSAAESQAFYRSLGCIDAEELNAKHVEREPFDCQLEYKL